MVLRMILKSFSWWRCLFPSLFHALTFQWLELVLLVFSASLRFPRHLYIFSAVVMLHIFGNGHVVSKESDTLHCIFDFYAVLVRVTRLRVWQHGNLLSYFTNRYNLSYNNNKIILIRQIILSRFFSPYTVLHTPIWYTGKLYNYWCRYRAI